MTEQIETKYKASWHVICGTDPECYILTVERNGEVQEITLVLEDITTVAFLMNHILWNRLGLEYTVRYPDEVTVQTPDDQS